MKFWLVFGMLRIGAVKPCSMGLPSLSRLPLHMYNTCVMVWRCSLHRPLRCHVPLRGPMSQGCRTALPSSLPWMVLALHAEVERFALEGIHGLQWLYMLKSHLHSGSGARSRATRHVARCR